MDSGGVRSWALLLYDGFIPFYQHLPINLSEVLTFLDGCIGGFTVQI